MEYKLTAYSIYEVGKRTDADGNPHQEDCIFPSCSEISGNSRIFPDFVTFLSSKIRMPDFHQYRQIQG